MPGCLVMTDEPSAATSAIGEAGVAAVGDLGQERVVAAGGPAARTRSRVRPRPHRRARRTSRAPTRATTRRARRPATRRVTRGQTTMSAPVSRAAAMPPSTEIGVRGDGRGPRLGQSPAGVEVGEDLPGRLQVTPARAAGRRRSRRRSSGADRGRSASAASSPASPDGFSPPALLTILIPRSRQVPSTCSSCPSTERAYPTEGSFCRAFPQDEHRQLGQVVAGQDVDRAALDHLA